MTTRLVQSGAGCVRRAINGTNARTLKTTRIARMDPKSFTAVAGPTIRSRSAGILLHDPDRFENSQDLTGGGIDRFNAHRVLSTIGTRDRKSTRLNSSHSQISYAVFCLKKK